MTKLYVYILIFNIGCEVRTVEPKLGSRLGTKLRSELGERLVSKLGLELGAVLGTNRD